MIKIIVTFFVLLVFQGNAIAHGTAETQDMENALFALQLKHSLKEKYILLSGVQDEQAKMVIACSILKETSDLLAYIELDAPSVIGNKEMLESLNGMALKEKQALKSSGLSKKYNCNNHITKGSN